MNDERSAVRLLRPKVLVAVVIAAAGLSAWALVTSWRLHCVSVPQTPFDSANWIHWGELKRGVTHEPLMRQAMIKDLINNALPGLTRTEIEARLGASPTHDDMRRVRTDDLLARRLNNEQTAYIQRGAGYYFDEYDWDLLYPIGTERIFIWDHRWQFLDPETEYLIIRVDENGEFESWFIDGSDQWPKIVGPKSSAAFRRSRE